MKAGFIGLGIMGRPMALNLLRGGVERPESGGGKRACRGRRARRYAKGNRGGLRGGFHDSAQRTDRTSGAVGAGRGALHAPGRRVGGGHELHHARRGKEMP